MADVVVGENPAVDVAKKVQAGDVRVMSTGVKVRLTPVGGGILTQVAEQIPEPVIPLWHDPERDEDVPNPAHPDYLAAVAKFNQQRAMSVLDAVIMMGVDLVEPMPAVETWLPKLKLLKIVVNAEDPIEVEFAYKRYIAVGVDDYATIAALSGVTEEAVGAARRGFRS